MNWLIISLLIGLPLWICAIALVCLFFKNIAGQRDAEDAAFSEALAGIHIEQMAPEHYRPVWQIWHHLGRDVMVHVSSPATQDPPDIETIHKSEGYVIIGFKTPQAHLTAYIIGKAHEQD